MENEIIENIVRIRGENVSLCLFRKDKLAMELYLKWLNDEDINGFIGHNYRNDTYEDVYNNFKREISPNIYRYNIVVNELSILIGICEIRCFAQARNAIISLYIGNKEYMGKGYGKEVLLLMIKYIFNELNIQRVGLTVFSDNVRAIKCYKSVGFSICGTEHRSDFHDGRYCDRIHMELFNDVDL